MKKTLLFSFLVLSLAAWSAQEPQIGADQSRATLKLSSGIEKVMAGLDEPFLPLRGQHFLAHIPGYFQPHEKQLPYALVADFNGDQVQDAILLGLSRDSDRSKRKPYKVKALLFYSSGTNYKVVPVEQWSLDFQARMDIQEVYQRLDSFKTYLSLLSAHEIKHHWVPRDRAAFKIELDLGPSQLWYFSGNAIQVVRPKLKN